MNRRHFLKASLYGTVLASSYLGLPMSRAFASHTANLVPRTLVNIMLMGGVDLRYAFVPNINYDSTYVDQFWNSRSALYSQGYPDYASMYSAEYQTVIDPISGFSFGIHNSCGWLAQQFSAGNVAIVANVFGSQNRRHDHSQLIVNTGDTSTGRIETNRNGWGGRLVETASGLSNVIAINNNVSIFCKGSNPANRLAQLIHGKNMRNIALPNEYDFASNTLDSRNIITRSLMAYYKARGIEIENEKPLDWPYRIFFQHNNKLRQFGNLVKTRLSEHAMPAPLANLNLNDDSFELQCRNLYDCTLTPDILNFKAISMAYDGWDTHTDQQTKLNKNLGDIFNINGGLDTVTKQIDIDSAGANNNLVYTINSDFGRQLAANGSLGTDHGTGSYSILIGNSVNGGIYGEMFPQLEAMPDSNDSEGRTPFEIPGTDIQGLTSFERVLSRSCDWVEAGTGASVFPNATSSPIESNVDLSNLLAF